MNVNLDVLELIFAQLDGSHLVNAALVSRAFLAGAIPSLYASIEYTPRHARRAQNERSPFATVAAHDNLGVHVKRIAIHAAPSFQSSANIVDPTFLRDLAFALRTTTNLRSFVCTVKILPPLLPHLLDKHRLHHVCICAPLGSRQMSLLLNRTRLHSLALDFPSWNVIDALPKWTASMQKTLAHLTLFMSQDTCATVLSATLAQLPRLRGLHVIGCPRITHSIVLKALSHTPDLRELSFTIFPSQDSALPPINFSLPPLTHLSIDVRASYPGLKSLIARIVSRLSPRDALAICGGWIGEIKGSTERTEPPPDAPANGPGGPPAGPGAGPVGPGPFGQNFHVWQGQVHLHGPMPGHGQGNDQANDPPLLGPAIHHGNANPNPIPAQPNPGNPPPHVFGFHFPFPFGNLNGNNNNNNNNNNHPPGGGPPNPPNLDLDPNAPSLVSSLPSTLSTLHLPQISPAGLREVIDRCERIQLLGIVMGNAFMSPTSPKPSKPTSRFTGWSRGRGTRDGVRPEINVLAGILSRARVLRDLIIDTSPTDIIPNTSGTGNSPGGPHSVSSGSYALLTPAAVRFLMRESPLLRRVVAEGRVWESTMPTRSPPVPFTSCLEIELSLTKARYAPGAGYNHAHGPPGFGSHGGGYGQMEASNDHWFWLTGSASGGKVHGGF